MVEGCIKECQGQMRRVLGLWSIVSMIWTPSGMNWATRHGLWDQFHYATETWKIRADGEAKRLQLMMSKPFSTGLM
jgi:hypothetical protein